jgi:hypothetical protein
LAAPKGLADKVRDRVAACTPPQTSEEVTQRRDGDTLEARSTSERIKTVEDLIAHIEVDLQVYEVSASEATKWEVASRAPDGTVTVTELHRVWVRLKPRPGPSVRECVELMIAAAAKPIAAAGRAAAPRPRRPAGTHWAVVVISDTHFGRYAWRRSTGHEDYDLDIAEQAVSAAANELLDATEVYRPARRTIALLGDIMHYDTPGGTTSSGTALDRDGRLQKMLEVGTATIIAAITRSAATVPTDVVLVNGNHDEALSWSLHRILIERFRSHKGVTIERDYTSRKYAHWGKNLLGFAHGHRAKAKLSQLMAIEAADLWAACPHREIHTGHFHSTAAQWSKPAETIDGVLVRTAPAICPPDQWTAEAGFVGSRQAMEAFLYDRDHGLTAMHVSPRRTDGRRNTQ